MSQELGKFGENDKNQAEIARIFTEMLERRRKMQ